MISLKSHTKIVITLVFLVLWFVGGLDAREQFGPPFIYSNAGKGEAVINAEDKKKIATAVLEGLKKLKVKGSVEGDGPALREYMEKNPNGIVVMVSYETPAAIFSKDDNSFSEKWLENGGIMIWEVFTPFSFRDHERLPKASFRNVFDIDKDIQKVLRPPKPKTKITDLGKRFMPSLEPFETGSPVVIAVLDELNFRYEVYGTAGDNDEYADPIMFRSPDMKGWFMLHHLNSYTDFADWGISTMKAGLAEDIGIGIAEFIVNRFVSFSVEPAGKLATTWGRVKL